MKTVLPDAPLLLLDSGNFSDAPTPAGDAKSRTLLAGMERLGYAAVNVGERDVRQGLEAFQQRVEGADLEFISANIVRSDTGEPLFKPHVMVEVPKPGDADGSRKVGIIGLMRYNPLFKQPGPGGSEIVIAHPNAAVAKSVEALRKDGAEMIVLLAAMHKDDSRRLVEEVPGIDYVLGSYGGIVTNSPDRVGETQMIYCGNRGQRIGETRVFFRDGKTVAKNRMHFLTASYPDNTKMGDFVRQAKAAWPAVSGTGK